ncbi:ATP-binding protein [Streptomyces pseudogriseolus]|uniref:ATP-binding protein n=1 Tax=Streptomyces pseudogriseolus TaxID=36817 RepID=UPI003489659A
MSKKSTVIARQEAYINKVEKEGFDFGLTVADAFVRSIRDLGYKSCGTALDELIDNSVEAGAQNVHVAFGYGKSDAKPESIAILDDGYGMVKKMIRAAVVWGGTDREGSRNLFGRYGYGLPSASVSQGKRFTVYSRTESGPFHAVTMDTEEIGLGKYIDLKTNRVVVPQPTVQELPKWVVDYANKNFPDGVDGLSTVVVWEKLDRLTWKTTKVLETKLLEHFGLVYRGFLRQTAITVNGKKVESLDPLFVTPGARYFDLDHDRAEALPELPIKVKSGDGKKEHVVKLRISYMPPTFFSIDKTRPAQGRNANPRLAIRKENHGIVVCRNGRQLDVIVRNPLTTFVNYDRLIGLELDFPAELDEEFGVTTAKQQITISDRIWDRLKEAGFLRILEDLRRRRREDDGDVSALLEASPEIPRPSERVMEEAEAIVRRRPAPEEVEREAEVNLQKEVDRIAEATGIDPKVIEKKKNEEIASKPFKVETESITGGPFFRVEQRGGQMVLLLNKAHRFFTDVYSGVPGVEGRQLRTGLELLLFAIGQCELDAPTAVRATYVSERIEWSNRLNVLLTLAQDQVDPDREYPEESEMPGEMME